MLFGNVFSNASLGNSKELRGTRYLLMMLEKPKKLTDEDNVCSEFQVDLSMKVDGIDHE